MKKILIADPDEELGSVYAEELAEEGYQVATCSDAAELMNAIVKERPDLIMIDTQMMLCPGQGFYREIENHLPVVPAIIYMSSLRSKPKKWAIPSENFLRKTCNLLPLKDKIKASLSNRPTKMKQQFQVPQKQMTFRWLKEQKQVSRNQ